MMDAAAPPSVIDVLGAEVTGVISPVSICMAIVVVLVRLLNPSGVSNSGAVFIASSVYQEKACISCLHARALCSLP
jgi:presenilin 1